MPSTAACMLALLGLLRPVSAGEAPKQFGEEMPFDGKRMVYGGFDPLVVRGR